MTMVRRVEVACRLNASARTIVTKVKVCESSRCRDATFCDDDTDCAASETCNGQGYCIERDQCLVDDDCDGNGTCNNGYCYAAQTCSDSNPCPERLDCVAGRCVEGICRSAADCQAGPAVHRWAMC